MLMSVRMSAWISVRLFVHMSVRMCVYMSVRLSVRLSVCVCSDVYMVVSTDLCMHVSVDLCMLFLQISVFKSVRISVQSFVCLIGTMTAVSYQGPDYRALFQHGYSTCIVCGFSWTHVSARNLSDVFATTLLLMISWFVFKAIG